MIRKTLIIMGIASISLVLAFPLRNAVYSAIIVPVAYLFWLLGLFYHSVHQSFWWGIMFIIVAIILFRGLLPQREKDRVEDLKQKESGGPVQSFSEWLGKSDRGVYFKWLVANRLGRVAHQILWLRQAGARHSFFEPLKGPGWNPNEKVQAYLETGLQGSFADYPRKRTWFSRQEKTPMDHDLEEVIGFLESQLKKDH